MVDGRFTLLKNVVIPMLCSISTGRIKGIKVLFAKVGLPNFCDRSINNVITLCFKGILFRGISTLPMPLTHHICNVISTKYSKKRILEGVIKWQQH